LPDLPTVAEGGLTGFDVTTWHGWLAPKGTPAAIVNKLSAQLAKIVRAPETMEKLAGDGGEAIASTPAQFGQFIAGDIARWTKLVKSTGLRVEQ
jgi:tripartite-type tricarboxylate transporter receptor subunit TctC